MKLLGPALLRIQPPEKEHQEGGKLRLFLRRGGPSALYPGKNRRGGLFRTKFGIALGHAVIGNAATLGVEVIMSRTQGVEKRRKAADANAADFTQPSYPLIKWIRLVHRQRLVRAERRQHARGAIGSQDGFVVA